MISPKRCLVLLMLFTGFAALQAQPKINTRLKKELAGIAERDQKYREFLVQPLDSFIIKKLAQQYHIPLKKFEAGLWQLQHKADSLNVKRVEAIITKHGYPGRRLVGEPENKAAFFVLQHSPKINTYLPIIEKAATNGELPFNLYAMMKDRWLMNNNKPQFWGSQAMSVEVVNSKTGKRQQVSFIWPVQDAANVNKRRKQAGFDNTVEDNAQRLGITYKPMTMKDVLDLQK